MSLSFSSTVTSQTKPTGSFMFLYFLGCLAHWNAARSSLSSLSPSVSSDSFLVAVAAETGGDAALEAGAGAETEEAEVAAEAEGLGAGAELLAMPLAMTLALTVVLLRFFFFLANSELSLSLLGSAIVSSSVG